MMKPTVPLAVVASLAAGAADDPPADESSAFELLEQAASSVSDVPTATRAVILRRTRTRRSVLNLGMANPSDVRVVKVMDDVSEIPGGADHRPVAG